MIGETISHYKIIEKLGEGGMGVVYKAEDTKLKRIVALKFLPAISLGETEEKSRFLREAQAAAALNHPNICTIHAIDEVDGQTFIAMEYIEGQSLQEKIRVGPLKLDEAIKFAIQISDGLQTAHEKGIIHRDIKSANVMITTKEQVKIMDFGLAKLTRGGTTLTKEGMTLGTVVYMSPEQARREVVDHRTDIWSLGVVLYEMLSGQLPFKGEYEQSIMYAIIHEDPEPVTALRTGVPVALDGIVAKALAKTRETRYQHVDELPADLRALDTASVNRSRISAKKVQQEPITKTLAGHVYFAWILAGILALAFLALAVVHFRQELPKSPTTRSFIRPPENTIWDDFALSPDGSTLVFVATDTVKKASQLWVRPLNALTAQPLAGTESATHVFWSPNSRFIGFYAGDYGHQKLKKIAVAGGPPIMICDAPLIHRGGGAWNQNDTIIFTTDQGIYQVSAAGGKPSIVTKLDTTHHETFHALPHFLPDGQHFFYLAITRSITGQEENTICVASLNGKFNKRLLAADSKMAYVGGNLLFVRDNTLLAQPFDANGLGLMGDAVAIAELTQSVTSHLFSASQNGILVYRGPHYSQISWQYFWYDRNGKNLGSIGDSNEYLGPRLSYDGKKIVGGISDAQRRNTDLWVYDLARNLRTRFTFEPPVENSPIWSPDGNHIVFSSARKGHSDLYQKSASGNSVEELLLASNLDKWPSDWSSDGRFIAYSTDDPKTKTDLWILPLFNDRQPVPFLQTEFDEYDARFSPDMHWIAYCSNESGRDEIYVRPFQGPGSKWQISTKGGQTPTWRRDGKELFYVSFEDVKIYGPMDDFKLTAVEVNSTGSTFEVSAIRPLFGVSFSYFDITADGQRFLVAVPQRRRLFPYLTLVTNWDQELKKK